MTLPIHSLVVSPRPGRDPRARGLLGDAHALGLAGLRGIECHDLFFVAGPLSVADRERLRLELLSDPVTQTAAWRPARAAKAGGRPVIEVALRPGVTDPVAEQVVRAARMLGIETVERAATGQRYVLRGRLTPAERHTLARRLLANGVIQNYTLGEITPAFPTPAAASGQVETIALRELEPAELLQLSRERRAALDVDEMRAIQDYYRAAGRDPTDVEFEMLAQTWSEHCVHKTFRARITVSGGWPEAEEGPNRQAEDGPHPLAEEGAHPRPENGPHPPAPSTAGNAPAPAAVG
ncbi:MAG: phosphoribosylformylglycinamidine synthase subunit PurS, partial [Anaerolineales bacterium]